MVFCAVAAAVGIVLGYTIAVLRNDSSRGPGQGFGSSVATRAGAVSSRPDDLASIDLTLLRRELEEERRAQRLLAFELEWLREELGDAASFVSAAETELTARIGDSTEPVVAATTAGKGASVEGSRAKLLQEEPWFDSSALEQVGYSSSEIQEIKSRFEELEMEKLYLADQSRREGTFGSSAYNRRLASLNSGLREDLGVQAYDAYLYATGRNNRVEVREVLDDSPASYAGIEAGDVVISYSGLRVFHPREFKRATATGELGERVMIEVLRDGELYRFSVSRGPLGIRMGRLKKSPDWRW